jgi:hypothetical protein
MNGQRHDYRELLPSRIIPALLSAGLFCGLSGVASIVTAGDDSISGFDQITLAPGDTGNCNSSPCTVYLEMPAGSGTYEVTGNETRIGEYPAGETVNLGSFWSSQAIAIKGMNVPKAYAYIPNMP